MKEDLEFIVLYIKNVSYIKLLNFIKKYEEPEKSIQKLKSGFIMNIQSPNKKSVINILKFEFNTEMVNDKEFKNFLTIIKEFLLKEKDSNFKIEYTTRQIIGNLKI